MAKLKNKKLYLMCGIPGIGKSTWLQNHEHSFKGSTKIISRDKIRFELLGEDEDYFGKEDKVWAEYVKQAKESLKYNENTILDATHLTKASREKILHALKHSLTDVEINIIYLHGMLETALEQNNNRSGRAYVPQCVIRRMSYSLQPPTIEETYIDKIYDVNIETDLITIKMKG